MKKIVILCSLILVISGCSIGKNSSDLKKIKASDDGINSYSLNLRIYGTYNNSKISKNLRIESYKNNQYMITILDNSRKDVKEGNSLETNDEIIYVIDNKTYVIDKKGTYVLDKGDVRFDNPSIYLSGLDHISKINKVSKKTIGINKYDVYDVVFSKKNMINILADTIYSDIKVESDVTGQVYIDQNGYIYRIIYKIADVTINANYYAININKTISIPAELK